ncbi:MAG TPA: uroporphyrinogen-III C-methyltransferase [Tepidisphaeraceae bacterium]|nr:uroporphyrinogen-III C-methyltransferase [Tepidisphaeraceae bacterium]
MSGSGGKGVVYLVGAGPGDPGLLTVRGRTLLERADVVVYDYLANPLLLRHAPTARAIYVGKKAAAHAFTQEQINELLVEQARAGQRVVRLKGGDPFVFGRGGEECEALAAAGIRFEVVPGITAAIAAPAYAGIPVTHRDFNSSFTFLTGHEKEEQYQDPQSRTRDPAIGSSDVDWSAIAKLPCLAFYMGIKSLPRICQNLIAHGMDPQTPAATIRWGTTPRQKTVMGTLADLAARVADAGLAPPALTIVGRVVSLRAGLNWFEQRPLYGQTIVVTRTREEASELSERLMELGANVIEAPTIEIVRGDLGAIQDALSSANSYHWVVFTSGNGARFTRERLDALGLDVRAFGKARVVAVGAETRDAVAEHLGLRADVCPDRAVADALADELVAREEVQGKRFLLLRADIARPVLVERLKQAGAAEVRDVAVYETKPAASLPPELLEALEERRVTWVTFTSSSTARNFVRLLGADYREKLAGVKVASIGPVTSATLRELGLEPTVAAQTASIQGLVDAVASG